MSKSIEILAHRCFGKRIAYKTTCNSKNREVREPMAAWLAQWSMAMG